MLDLRAVAEAKLRAAGVDRIEHVDLCTSCRADLFFSHRRDGGVTGRQAGLAWLTRDAPVHDLDPAAIARNLDRVRERIADAGRDPAAWRSARRSSTSPVEELPALAEGGIELVGENRAQDLLAKRGRARRSVRWDFIGALQSRKVRDVAPRGAADPLRGVRVRAGAARPSTRPARCWCR